VVAPFCVGYYVSYLLRTVNAVIAPELVRELDLGAADLGLLTSTYFLAFAIGQLPVGAALDRYGARRVVAALLAVATGGVLIFSGGHHFATLAFGRGLVGLGVSACLMGAFKAFGAAFPPGRQVALTGLVMSAGAVGALTASLPLEWALPLIGWRHALMVVAAASAVAAVLIATVARETTESSVKIATVEEDRRTLAMVFRAPAFWRFAPQAALFTGGFMAVQSLWAVPWLMTVDGRTPAGAAGCLLVLNAGMLAGQLSIVAGATPLARGGWSRERLMTAGLAAALLIEGLIIWGVIGVASGTWLWFAFGFFAAAGAQVYGVTAGYFPASLSGRVSTAVNLLAFVGAFVIQWGIGLSVDALARANVSPTSAMRWTFGALWLGQLAAVAFSARIPLRPERWPPAA
jgi:MFS family permease